MGCRGSLHFFEQAVFAKVRVWRNAAGPAAEKSY